MSTSCVRISIQQLTPKCASSVSCCRTSMPPPRNRILNTNSARKDFSMTAAVTIIARWTYVNNIHSTTSHNMASKTGSNTNVSAVLPGPFGPYASKYSAKPNHQEDHKQTQAPLPCPIPTRPHKLQGSTINHIHLLRWDASAIMTSNRGRRNLYEPLSFTRVSRQRTDIPLSQEAESLVNLFSHAYDHSYDLLQDTDDIRCITRALGLSMEAVKAARTARSSQEEADDNNQSSDEDDAEHEPHAHERHRVNENNEAGAAQDDDNSLHQPPPKVTQANHDMDESDDSTHNDDSIDDHEAVDGDNTDTDTLIAQESMYSEDSSASGDLTDSEYDDDVSEVSLLRL